MMNKALHFFLILLLLSTLFGCVNEEQLPEGSSQLKKVVFHAGWAQETKTVLQEDGSVWWSPGDEISLFVGSGADGGYKLTATNTEPATAVDFVGQIGGSGSTYTAIYPYNESNRVSDNSVYITIPTRQIAKEGTFAEGALISMAVSEDENLYFHNLCGGIKFSVANEGINEVEFAVLDAAYYRCISGEFCFDKEGNLETIIKGSSKVSISAPDGQCFVPGKYYYVTTIPTVSFEKGLMVTYRKETAEATLVLDDEVVFKKSVFKRLYNNDAGLEFHAKAPKHATIPYFASLLPYGIEDRSKITEAHFYVLSDKTTETIIDSYPDNTSEPIYFELNGTVANYYTSAEVYKVLSANSLFSQWTSLQHLDLSKFDVSSCTDFGGMFQMCFALKDIQFGDFDVSIAKNMNNMFHQCVSLESIDLSCFNTLNVQDMNYMFTNCRSLKELDLSNFDTRNVTMMGELFEGCYSLEKLDISGFTSDRLEYAPGLFSRCVNLLKLDMGSFDISVLLNNFNTCLKLASRSRNCAILCSPATKEILLSAEAHLSPCEPYIQWFVPGEVLPELSMQYNPEFYYSTDYSLDKKVKMLNVATEGKGVDVVIMGEAYSDRLIANGTYEQDMNVAMNQIFSIEPLKSFKHLFNVYMVYAISENEVVDELGGFTIFKYDNAPDDNRCAVDRDDIAIDEYVSSAIGPKWDRKDTEVTTLIVVNENSGDGVAMVQGSLNYSDDEHYDYPAKLAGVAFVCKSPDSERFYYTTCHEFGHAFAALHDEYVERLGEMPTWESESKQSVQSILGWWSNVSFTSDPSRVSWRRFMENGSGYDENEVSIIEGALYSQGIWRSVDQSMMNAGGEFSVPAREAIYKRMHKIAYGEEWQYSFENFVNWDRGVLASTQQSMMCSPSKRATSFDHPKPFFSMEESISKDGKKRITIIIN